MSATAGVYRRGTVGADRNGAELAILLNRKRTLPGLPASLQGHGAVATWAPRFVSPGPQLPTVELPCNVKEGSERKATHSVCLFPSALREGLGSVCLSPLFLHSVY